MQSRDGQHNALVRIQDRCFLLPGIGPRAKPENRKEKSNSGARVSAKLFAVVGRNDSHLDPAQNPLDVQNTQVACIDVQHTLTDYITPRPAYDMQAVRESPLHKSRSSGSHHFPKLAVREQKGTPMPVMEKSSTLIRFPVVAVFCTSPFAPR
jgi:hypothetical protein